MPRVIDVQERNRKVVDKLGADSLRDSSHPYRGKQIAVVNGQVVVVADDLSELVRRLKELGANREDTLCFEGGVDYNEVHEIWSAC